VLINPHKDGNYCESENMPESWQSHMIEKIKREKLKKIQQEQMIEKKIHTTLDVFVILMFVLFFVIMLS